MISYIKGIVAEKKQIKNDAYVIIEAAGVGYEICTNLRFLSCVPEEGSEFKMLTYLHVTENDRILYGFVTDTEKDVFKNLISVNGVGPKGALSILDIFSLNELVDAIVSNDVKAITKAQGIGSKTAQKIIIELKDKLNYTGEMLFGETVFGDEVAGASKSDPVSEAAEALGALGFSRTEAMRGIRQVKDAKDMTTEELIKQALKHINAKF